MKKIEEQTIKDFVELKISYKETRLDKILKGYDENSGESILEDKVYYSINELDVYANGIKAYIEKTCPFLDNQELIKWLMVVRGLIIKNVQFEPLSEKLKQDMFELFMKMHNLFTYLNENKNAKIDKVKVSCNSIINYIQEIQKWL